jgi:hypothetical protein
MRPPSVVNDLACAERARLPALAAGERVGLALALGARSLEIYAAASGLSRAEARRAVERRRQARRRPSACLDALLA